MAKDQRPVIAGSTDVDAFLKKVASAKPTSGAGRLIFALDATASREATWDQASHLQSGMFETTQALGNLALQLCYYRGYREFEASSFQTDSQNLAREMLQVRCLGGLTQIRRVLEHGLVEHRAQRIAGLIFIGDAIEESPDVLCHLAGQCGLLNLPLFIFQEGGDSAVQRVFQQMAQLSGGAWAPFNRESADSLRALLQAVAVFAAGGRKALADYSAGKGTDVKRLTRQLRLT